MVLWQERKRLDMTLFFKMLEKNYVPNAFAGAEIIAEAIEITAVTARTAFVLFIFSPNTPKPIWLRYQ
jgi:hypothetical protein